MCRVAGNEGIEYFLEYWKTVELTIGYNVHVSRMKLREMKTSNTSWNAGKQLN